MLCTSKVAGQPHTPKACAIFGCMKNAEDLVSLLMCMT